MHLTLRQAEQRVLASKSTILRAIKSGRLSAERDGPEGSYRIEPSELFRVFPPKPSDPALNTPSNPLDMRELAEPQGITVLAMRAEVEKLAALLDAERRRGDELREERDSWRGQAERLALMQQPVTVHPSAPVVPEDQGKLNILERIGRALRG